MIQTQFDTSIQIIHTDSARDYFNSELGDFFKTHGIIHSSSCVHTPQQNGVAERKNRHILEVARAIMFSSNVPSHFWGEAVLTATYLINRMPSRVLGYKIPSQVLLETYPHCRLISTLPAKVFGCSVFTHSYGQGKLEPKSLKCIFLGYSATQKGYKCYEPRSRKFIVSMDASFHEFSPYFANSARQRENDENDFPNWLIINPEFSSHQNPTSPVSEIPS